MLNNLGTAGTTASWGNHVEINTTADVNYGYQANVSGATENYAFNAVNGDSRFKDTEVDGDLTVTGNVAGTPVFMPREQVTNFKYVKPASDVWSMGATLYYMLTSRFPRDMRRGQDPMEAILHGQIVPVRKRDSSIPTKVAEVIDRALDNSAKNRYKDATEMRKALAKAL